MPIKYTPEEIAAAKSHILDEISTGKSLDAVVRDDMGLSLPSRETIYTWLREGHNNFDAVFSDDYERARDLRAERIFEEILEISDTPIEGEVTKIGTAGIEVTKSDMINHRRLQVDSRKWILARMSPKKYGDKIETTIQGGDKPIETVDYSQLSPEFLEELAKQSNAGKTRSK